MRVLRVSKRVMDFVTFTPDVGPNSRNLKRVQ